MSGDYLWDRSGEPDPEVLQLEGELRALRASRPAPDPGLGRRGPGRREGRPAAWVGLSAAAALLAAGAALWPPATPREGWDLEWVSGPSWGDARVVREERLGPGRRVETGAERARLAVGDIGVARLEPRTRVRLVDAGRRAHRLALERGVMHAVIWAPPRRFVVDTPSATAVDLGCSYTIEVDDEGSGLLRVVTGWVGVEHLGLRSLVPAGASCPMRAGRGPGTPFFETASPAFVEALGRVDFAGPGPLRDEALGRLLSTARSRDALTLWHLLARLEGPDRERVLGRLAGLVPPPAGATRDGLLAGDRQMLDLWWDELGLGSAEFWRDWTGPLAE